jgi:hypothetical protein
MAHGPLLEKRLSDTPRPRGRFPLSARGARSPPEHTESDAMCVTTSVATKIVQLILYVHKHTSHSGLIAAAHTKRSQDQGQYKTRHQLAGDGKLPVRVADRVQAIDEVVISITNISHRKYSTPTHEAGRTCSITNISHRGIEGHSWVPPRANTAFSAMQPLCFFLFRSPFAATCISSTRPRKCVEWHPLSLPSLQHPGLSVVLWLAMLAMFGCSEWGRNNAHSTIVEIAG